MVGMVSAESSFRCLKAQTAQTLLTKASQCLKSSANWKEMKDSGSVTEMTASNTCNVVLGATPTGSWRCCETVPEWNGDGQMFWLSTSWHRPYASSGRSQRLLPYCPGSAPPKLQMTHKNLPGGQRMLLGKGGKVHMWLKHLRYQLSPSSCLRRAVPTSSQSVPWHTASSRKPPKPIYTTPRQSTSQRLTQKELPKSEKNHFLGFYCYILIPLHYHQMAKLVS